MISRGTAIFIRHFVMTQEDDYLIYRDTINDYRKVSDQTLHYVFHENVSLSRLAKSSIYIA